jgi:hypothetical protein
MKCAALLGNGEGESADTEPRESGGRASTTPESLSRNIFRRLCPIYLPQLITMMVLAAWVGEQEKLTC